MLSTLTLFVFLTLILIFTLYAVVKNKNEEETKVVLKKKPGRWFVLEILPLNSPKREVREFGEKSGSSKGKKKRGNKRSGSDNIEELVCFCPFKKPSRAVQRKIKQHYDQLVKANGSKGLTVEQVGQFVNGLVEARDELQEKSKVIERKFTITKALLFKADRLSYDRLSQQVQQLELKHKRLEEDALMYNWLQDQLKASPAYKKMLEINASMEMKEKSSCLLESEDADYSDISFEELLEQEKKDSFWQRNGKLKTSSG